MATTYVSPPYMPPDPFDRAQIRMDKVDAERYALRAQDIMDAAHRMRDNSGPTRVQIEDTFSYMTTAADSAVNHPIAEVNKKIAHLERHVQLDIARLSDAGSGLNTRIDHLLSQIENQHAAILELSRIIDELKQDGFQPPEPLEDVD